MIPDTEAALAAVNSFTVCYAQHLKGEEAILPRLLALNLERATDRATES